MQDFQSWNSAYKPLSNQVGPIIVLLKHAYRHLKILLKIIYGLGKERCMSVGKKKRRVLEWYLQCWGAIFLKKQKQKTNNKKNHQKPYLSVSNYNYPSELQQFHSVSLELIMSKNHQICKRWQNVFCKWIVHHYSRVLGQEEKCVIERKTAWG